MKTTETLVWLMLLLVVAALAIAFIVGKFGDLQSFISSAIPIPQFT